MTKNMKKNTNKVVKKTSGSTTKKNEVLLGLTVSILLNTKSKLFSAGDNNPKKINDGLAPGDIALPGILPSLNEAAIKKAIILGNALK